MAARRALGASLIVLLAPLAAIVGTSLAWRDSTAANLGLSVGRRDVIRIARAEAAQRGVKADGWAVVVDLKSANPLRHYLTVTATPAQRAEIVRVLPPVVFRGALVNPERSADSVFVQISPAGRLVSWSIAPRATAKPATESDARRVAEVELQRRLGAERAGFVYSGSGVERHEATSSEVRRFNFRRQYGKDLSLEAHVDTSGADVIGFGIVPSLDAGYIRRFVELTDTMASVRVIPVIVLVLLALAYLIVRFVRRFREQEIPLKRVGIVIAFVFLAFLFASFGGGESQRMEALILGFDNNPGIDKVMLVVMSVIMAGLVGLAWGACEADVREAYPEKLTSTDALLGGAFSSRAIRASLIAGLTIGGYAILATALDQSLRFRSGGWATISTGELVPYQTSYPALAILLFSVTNLPTVVALLLAAVSVTHRRGSGRTARMALVAVVGGVFLLTMLGNHHPIAWGPVQASVAAAVLLVPFFIADVLAVFVVSAMSTWAILAASMIAQPAPMFRNAGAAMLLLLVVLVIGASIAAFRRRNAAEEAMVEEVARPEYARNIDERLMLRGEMETARQAQMRVMPRVVPNVEGVRLAARHSDADELGEDYYEFFPSPTHLGVSLADARLGGLSSALCVSMLKGLLLNYSARLDSTRDLADRVYRQLSSIFGDDLPLSFFFGRLDRATGEFHFASFGDVPHAVVVRDGVCESLEGEELVSLAGATESAAGCVIVYTASLAELRDRDGETIGDDVLRNALAQTKTHDPQRLLDALAELASQHTRGVETSRSWAAVAIAPAEVQR